MDWDGKASNYFANFLSPFCKEMLQPDAQGVCRNLLVNKIREKGPEYFVAKSVVDFGCGPGNILLQVKDILPSLTGVDLSSVSLKIAAEKAKALNFDFFPVQADIRNWKPEHKYDVIFAVNSILPESREDILEILATAREALREDGQFWAVMPSFDTCIHLLECMRRNIESKMGAEAADQAVTAFRQAGKMDERQLSYADDGEHSQCFHTPASLEKEFAAAGLRLLEPPQKIYYPWGLSSQYGYGNYPGEEEIWDWFILAGKAR